jgi:thermosome
MAAKIMGDIMRTALGPRAMRKMIVETFEVTVTSDGITLLEKINIQHPTAKIIAESSKWTDIVVGDGTTSVAVFAASLLERAQELIEMGLHPTTIVDGYLDAGVKAEAILDELVHRVDPEDRKELVKVATTAIETKIDSLDTPILANLVVEAVLQVTSKRDDTFIVDKDALNVVKKWGFSLASSELVHGMAIWREPTSHSMPTRIEDAKIALINPPFEIKKTVITPEIRMSSPGDMKAFTDEEHRVLMTMVEKVLSVGANVVVCAGGLDDYVQIKLGRLGILAVRRAQDDDMKKLAKAIGGRIVNEIETLAPEDLGYAKLVETRRLEWDTWLFFEGCRNPKAVTLLIRGGTSRVVDEAERAVNDAIMATKAVIEGPVIVVGGGAVEAEIAQRIRAWSRNLHGRKQLVARKFAEAVECIPTALAQSAGMQEIDTLAELRTRHSDGGKWFGVDVFSGKVSDMFIKGVLEPYIVKLQVLKSAVETAAMILRIDGLVIAPKKGPRPRHTSMTPGQGNALSIPTRNYPDV